MSDLGVTELMGSPKPIRRSGGRTTAVLVVLFAVIVGVGAVVLPSAWGKVFGSSNPDFSGAGSGQVIAHVVIGASAGDIGDELRIKGVVKSAGAFRKAASKNPKSRTIQPGYYRMRLQMKASLALDLMLNPISRLRSRVTIPEGTSLARTLRLIAANTTGVPLADLETAAKNTAAIGLPDYAKGHVEGFLFPATYEIEPNTSAVEVLSMMTQRFGLSATTLGLVDGARANGLTPLQVVTLASIIERESAGGDDRGKVAQVFINRFRRGMTFGSEATVRYALGYPTRELTATDLKVNSPYNTYRYAGFPPGPIGNPGDAALKAAINPTPGPWLYFFTRADRTTVFSTTAAQFEASQRGNT